MDTKQHIRSGIGFLRHTGLKIFRLKRAGTLEVPTHTNNPSPNSIIPMKLHLCIASVRLYCRHKITIHHFITQIKKSLSDFKTAVVEVTAKSSATSPSRKLIYYDSIITQMLVVSEMAATYRSLSIKLNNLSKYDLKQY